MALKAHHLRPAPGAKTAKTRVGRGEGSKGKTAGRGTKGTKARYQVPERFEGGQTPLHMRLPKLRGFKNPFKVDYQVVNLDERTQLLLTDVRAAGATAAKMAHLRTLDGGAEAFEDVEFEGAAAARAASVPVALFFTVAGSPLA